tara:strand:+ start:18503 stop:19240 length:738 start_codon:yes stop_codon:yes gene_type:complete
VARRSTLFGEKDLKFYNFGGSMIGSSKKTKKNKNNDEEKEETAGAAEIISLFSSQPEQPSLRMTGIYGDINEEKASEALYGLLMLASRTRMMPEDPEDEESTLVEVVEPIEFVVSTYGGSANEMFALFDAIRMLQDTGPEILTIGLGKVMSAGVLLLASGTKGKRRIGRNCRIMIHGVISGQSGNLIDIENEFDEAKSTQKQYIKALASQTNMTEKYLRELIKRKTNVYFDAEEAVELGIADLII